MRTKVFYNLPEAACYGCTACEAVCPVSAISMKPDSEGFLFPSIDTGKCIECGLCEKTCITQKPAVESLFHKTPAEVDAAWEKRLQDRLESTSGGLFYAMAMRFVKKGGIVYGAALDENFTVRHLRCDSLDTLKRLRGSKYVQSNLEDVFKSIKGDLKAGREVLFSGTPCQVAGLLSFLRKRYENLTTIDLVCHGVPSPLIFKEHINYIEKAYGDKLADYKFRGKNKGGWRSYIYYIFNNLATKSFFWGGEFFAIHFYKSNFNRRSCFTCDFSRKERVGDITLSDFWNAEKYCKPLRIQRKYGFNMVMCNTAKGQSLYNEIKEEVESLTLPAEIAIKGDVRLRHTEAMPPRRATIFEDYHKHGFEWLVANTPTGRSLKSRLIPVWAKNLIYELKARL